MATVRTVGSLVCDFLALLVLPLHLHADVLDGVVTVHLHELGDWRHPNAPGDDEKRARTSTRRREERVLRQDGTKIGH